MLPGLRELAYLNKGIHLSITDKREKEENGTEMATAMANSGVNNSIPSKDLSEFVELLDATREKLTEKIIQIETEKNDVPVEIALQYNTSFSENVHSYVNNINTIEGGTHLAGFRRGLTGHLKTYAEKSGMLAKTEI